VLASSVHLGFARVFDAALRMVSEMPFAGIGCEWEFQCSLPQWRTEGILADRFALFGGVVERGVEVVGLDGREDGVLVRFAEGSELLFERVVGAGGAHSVVRSSLDAPLEGVHVPGHGAGRRRGPALPAAPRRVGAVRHARGLRDARADPRRPVGHVRRRPLSRRGG
jgi:2-polyprenyl-6-methoxyphenol hydroxylase-like FAD-dependent oxidoreductase